MPPRRTAEAPGTDARVPATSPAVSDSATARVAERGMARASTSWANASQRWRARPTSDSSSRASAVPPPMTRLGSPAGGPLGPLALGPLARPPQRYRADDVVDPGYQR